MAKVGIIGTGRLGTRLAEQLLSNGMCERVALWNRSQPRLSATVESLRMWADFQPAISAGVEVLGDSDLNELECVVVAAKERYDPRVLLETEGQPSWLPRDLRYVGLSRDIHVIRNVCRLLHSYKGRVVVVTNPVDVVTTLVAQWCPAAVVLGSGIELDERRMARELSRLCASPLAEFRCTLGGEHGGKLVPIKSLWSERAQRAESAVLNSAMEEAREFGFRVVRGLGFTLQDAAFVIGTDLTWLLGQGAIGRVRSFSVPNGGGAIGRPLRWRANGELDVLNLDSGDSAQLSACQNRIAEVVRLALSEWSD